MTTTTIDGLIRISSDFEVGHRMPLVSVADESVHTGRWPKTIDRESVHASDFEDQNVHTNKARPTGMDSRTEKDHEDSVGPEK